MLLLTLFVVLLRLCLCLSADGHGRYYQQLYNDTFQGSSHHKPWKALETVDGLRNEHVVILISGTVAGNFKYLRERIISSQRTWMKLFANAFVLVEDTFQARHAFRHCKILETPHYTSFECHNEPTWVLSRKCIATRGGGPGPCCKVDDLFTYLMIDRPDVYSHIKYAIHGDDDNFIRVDQLLMFLAAVERTGLSTIPIVGNGQMGEYKEHVYGTKGCGEIHTFGWYQPLFINRAAMELMKVAFSSYGVWETCDNFHVTHDVGLGPFLWLFGVYHLRIPGVYVANHDIRTGTVVTHKVVHDRKEDSCDNRANYNESQRYNQKILMGCGDVNELQGKHKAGKEGEDGHKMYNDNYELWAMFNKSNGDATWGMHAVATWEMYNVTLYANGSQVSGSLPGEENKVRVKHILNMATDTIASDGTFKGDRVVEHYLPVMSRMDGYEKTEHSKKYNIVKEWVGFKRKDCAFVTGADVD